MSAPPDMALALTLRNTRAELPRLAAAVEALQVPETRAKLESQGAIVIGSSPEEFRADIQREVAHWAEQFKAIKIETQ